MPLNVQCAEYILLWVELCELIYRGLVYSRLARDDGLHTLECRHGVENQTIRCLSKNWACEYREHKSAKS